MILPQTFYEHNTITIAKKLLECYLVHLEGEEITLGRIVETEAYLVNDPAAHAFIGKTNRNSVLFGPVGHAYVYFIYGRYECLNFVAEPEGQAGCVLVRALEPVSGIPVMRQRRPAARTIEDLAAGPGRLTMAMGITRKLNGSSLITGPLAVRKLHVERANEITVTSRIGITHCADWPLRFFITGNRFVSRTKPS